MQSSRSFNGISHIEAPIVYQYDAVGNLTEKSDFASFLSYGSEGKNNAGNAGPNAVQTVNLASGGLSHYSYDNNGNRIRYTHRDRLGSVMSLTDHNNLLMEHRSYDPFGKPRHGNMQDPLLARLSSIAGGTPFTTRGFTDHEHLDDAELIHMNGRVYDYNLGRFLSVDPFIQAPGNSQSMNPYSYIMNNPLAGTDPSGCTACAATDNCEKKPERQRESFSGGIVRGYIQVYWPAVNNGLTSGKQSYGKVTNVDISQIGAPAMASFSATPNEINVTNSQSETASLAKMFGYESPEEAEAAHEKLQAEIQDAIDRSIEVSMQTIRDSTS